MAQSMMLNDVAEANYRRIFSDEEGVVSRGFPKEYVREVNQFEGPRTPNFHIRLQTTGSQYPSSGMPHGYRHNLSADMHLFVYPQDSMYIHGINLGPNVVDGHVEGIQRINLGPNVVADGYVTSQFDFAGENHSTPHYGQHAPAFSRQGSRPQRTSLEVYTYISHQQTSFLHLTNALEQMTSAQETLKEEVRRMEDEISKQSFQNNLTEKDYRLICQENEYMQKLLQNWQCSKCTFSNHCALNVCEMCNTKRV